MVELVETRRQCRVDRDEVPPGIDVAPALGFEHQAAELPAEAVAHDGTTVRAADCERHVHAVTVVGQQSDPDGSRANRAAMLSQSIEISRMPDAVDQALSLLRPLSRRFRRMARPALSDMRWRKPWRRARRRLFGWKVRFMFLGLLGGASAGCAAPPSVPRSGRNGSSEPVRTQAPTRIGRRGSSRQFGADLHAPLTSSWQAADVLLG